MENVQKPVLVCLFLHLKHSVCVCVFLDVVDRGRAVSTGFLSDLDYDRSGTRLDGSGGVCSSWLILSCLSKHCSDPTPTHSGFKYTSPQTSMLMSDLADAAVLYV